MAPTPKKVRYNIMMPLVCEEHHEHGPLLCCPFPGCRNGTDAEEIQAVAPAIDAKVYRRTVWTDAEGEILFLAQGIDSIARAKAVRDILAALPGIWTKSLTEDVLAPKKACMNERPPLEREHQDAAHSRPAGL